MIELTSLARPYAKAIFSAALEAGEVSSVESELNLLGQAIQTEQINKIIENPELSKTETAEKLISVFEAELSSLSKRLINVLADNGRLNLLYAIFEIYQDLLQEHNNQSSIEVVVASEPSDESKENIINKLQALHGASANINFKEDASIMGGMFLKVGDETLDLSIKGRVKKLVNQLNF
jgi:F-type H+-transporting ATPase subunit delta